MKVNSIYTLEQLFLLNVVYSTKSKINFLEVHDHLVSIKYQSSKLKQTKVRLDLVVKDSKTIQE